MTKRAMIEDIVQRDSQGDEDSLSERPSARTALVGENEIIDEDSEPSEQSMELCPHEQPARPRPSAGSSSPAAADGPQLDSHYQHRHKGTSGLTYLKSGGRPDHAYRGDTEHAQTADDQALFWDILNE